MKIENTNYGKRVTIEETPNNSEFVYEWRNVRTINGNNPKEQELINELEKGEKKAERKLMILIFSLDNFFKTATSGKECDNWEKNNRMNFNEYYHDQIKTLQEQVNDFSFEYANKSRHGWCL